MCVRYGSRPRANHMSRLMRVIFVRAGLEPSAATSCFIGSRHACSYSLTVRLKPGAIVVARQLSEERERLAREAVEHLAHVVS